MTIFKYAFIYVILYSINGCGVQDIRDSHALENAKEEAIEISKLKKEFKYGMVWIYVDDNNDSFSGWVKKSYSDKKLSELGYLKNGQKQGLWLSWHENGQKAGEVEWHNDRLSGTYDLWHENSNLHVSGQTMDGEMNGEWKEYYTTGRLEAHSDHNMGKLIWKKVWLPNGQKCVQSEVKNGNGFYFEYNETESSSLKRIFKNGREIKNSTTNSI
ncbi:hypothetical protein N9N13_03225 [Opitutales bacterium]|jgi:antitoxin component YwqK of YwqJK toxin-antitoxin module|nr:hypothetical protein [Opitutales bacterium]